MNKFARGGWINRCLPSARLTLSCFAILLLVAGCNTGPLSVEPMMAHKTPEERLRIINSLTLDEHVAQEPETTDSRELLERYRQSKDADGQMELTLEACRESALKHNLDLQVQLINPTITAQSISEEEARFESVFFGNLDFSKTDSPTSSTLSGSQVENWSGNLGVRVPLVTGGTVTFSSPFNRLETNNIFSTLNPAHTADFNASISQPLLRGAGKRANTHALRIAHYSAATTEARTKLQVIQVLAAVDRVYWRLYAARRELEVRVQEYELALMQLGRAQRREAAGDIPEVDVIRAQSGVAERLEAIIIAENAVRDRQRDLKRVLNLPGLGMETPTAVVPATEPNPIRYELAPAELIEVAMVNRMEMLELELQLLQDESTIEFQRNQALWLLNLDYNYGSNGLGGTFNDAIDLAIDKSFEDHRVAVRGEVPLGNEAAESRLRRAQYVRLQRLASKESRRQMIEQEIYNAIDQLEANWQRVLASRQNAILNARTLEAEMRQYDLDTRTSTDVLDAQTRLANAQLAEIRALVDYQVTQIDIAAASGMLLGAAQVRWEPIIDETIEQ